MPIPHIIFGAVFILSMTAGILDYAFGFSYGFIFFIPAASSLWQIVMIWMDREKWNYSTGSHVRAAAPLYLGVLVFSFMEILAFLDPVGANAYVFSGFTWTGVIMCVLWIPAAIGCVASMVFAAMANRYVYQTPANPETGNEIMKITAFTVPGIVMMYILAIVQINMILSARVGDMLHKLFEVV